MGGAKSVKRRIGRSDINQREGKEEITGDKENRKESKKRKKTKLMKERKMIRNREIRKKNGRGSR